MAAAKNNAEAMLARLDERTAAFARSLDELRQNQTKHAEQILAALKMHMDDDATHFKEHDGRLKLLERWRWLIVGGAGLGGFIIWLWKG